MIHTLHKDGRVELVDTIDSLIVDKLRASVTWQAEVSWHDIAFDEMWDWLSPMSALRGDDTIHVIAAMTTTHAKNENGRLFSVGGQLLCAWCVYWQLVSQLFLYCCNKAVYSFQALLMSCNKHVLIGLLNAASGPPGSKLDENQYLTLYAEILFIHASGKAYFRKKTELLLRNDPKLDQDSHGQALWFYAKCYCARRLEFDNLVIDDVRKNKPEFAAYVNAAECVSYLDKKCYTDRSFSVDTPSCFFDAWWTFQ